MFRSGMAGGIWKQIIKEDTKRKRQQKPCGKQQLIKLKTITTKRRAKELINEWINKNKEKKIENISVSAMEAKEIL